MKTCKHIILFIFLFLCLSAYSARGQFKVEEMKRKGLILLQTDKVNEAIDQFNLYIKARPQNGEGYYLRGLCYEKKRDFQNAVYDFQTAVYLNPADEDYNKNLNRLVKLWNQELYNGIDENKKTVKSNPAYAKGYLEIARAYKYLGLNDYSEKWYDDYLKLEPSISAEEVINYSEVLAKTGSLQKGERLLKSSLDKYSDDSRLWSRYGYFELWLGKLSAAKDAFNKALSLNAGLKEASDGLEQIRNQEFNPVSIAAVPDTSGAIPQYYDLLKANPNDDETRFKLIDRLVNAGRFDEARRQLIYLQPNYEDSEKFKALSSSIESKTDISAINSIDELKTMLASNPNNAQLVRKISDYYFNLSQYQESGDVLKYYLAANPENNEMRYQYANILLADKKLEESYQEMKTLLDRESKPLRYRILAGQLGVWLDRDTSETKSILEGVMLEDPDNFQAIVSMAYYYYHRMKLDISKEFADRAKAIDPNDSNVIKLLAVIDTQKMRIEKEKMWKRFETGQKLFKERKYEEAKPYYEEIMSLGNTPNDVRSEYAFIKMNMGNYREAIPLYDSLLVNNQNLEFEKLRGKAYLLAGDSLKAASIFETLAKENPDDPECLIFLGDSYTKLKKFDDARKVYRRVKPFAPQEYDIDERIGDLPPEKGTFRYFMRSFTTDIFSYLTLEPVGRLYSGNDDFDLLYGGIKGETALNFAVSAGGEYLRGNLSNADISLPFSTVKGSIFIKTSDKTSAGFSYGRLNIKGFEDQPLIDAFVNYDNKEYVKGAISYNMTDAAFLLYSPWLVNNRIKAHNINLNLGFNYEDKLKLMLDYRLLITEKADIFYGNLYQSLKSNIGNYFTGRIGKGFHPGFFVGYEYYYTDFKYINLGIYYAPEQFSSHSLWSSWQITSDYEWDVYLEGKIGYVPQFDAIIREGKANIVYKLTGNFKIGLKGQIGDDVRFGSTYKSGSLYMNAIWSF